MKKTLLLLLPLLFIGLGALVIWDFYDRGLLDSSENYPEEKALFHQDKTMEEIQAAYKDNSKNPEYFFPRKEIKKTVLYNNSPLTSRLNSTTLSSCETLAIRNFFNEPKHFDWAETTWSPSESEYILRFFDKEENEIGTVWLCLAGCGMTKAKPFSPKMKFGSLSELGQKRLSKIIVTIEGTDAIPQDCPIQPNTASQYYDSGQLKSIGPVAEEHREFSEYRMGYWHEFYENGQLKSSGNYKLDTFIQCCYDGPCDWYYSYKYGEWKYYYDNGKLKAKGTYQIIKKQEDTSCQGGGQINFGTVTDSWQFYDREGKQITPNKNDIAEIEITGIIYGWEMEIQ